MNPSVLWWPAGRGSMSGTRSLVTMPASMQPMTAFSTFSPKAVTSGVASSSPRFRMPPVQAKIDATEFVLVGRPLRCS